MCGLLGYIGTSKDNLKTQNLITSLFQKTQIRGTDAAGYYCLSEFQENKVFYHKQPGPSEYVISDPKYHDLWRNKTNLGLFHCRAASTGVGVPAQNQNNHPFVSNDYSKAVIHNGLIVKHELSMLKKIYELTSECDSEIILRVLEQENRKCIENLSFFFSTTKDSHFSVAYSENSLDERRLFLFRNKHRPLYFANLTEELGQIVFFSTIDIFLSCIENLNNQNIKIKPQKITEIHPNEIFEFKYKKNQEIDVSFYKAESSYEDLIIEDIFYQINHHVSKKFTVTKTATKNLEHDLLKAVDDMQDSQKELVLKTLNFLQKKEIDQATYEETVKSIREINKKLNYIITTL